MPRVFVVQESRSLGPGGVKVPHDYSSAHQFGSITFLIPPRRIVEESGKTETEILCERLGDLQGDDYLLFSGDTTLCGLAGAVALSMMPEEVQTLNVLKWDRENRKYIPHKIKLP